MVAHLNTDRLRQAVELRDLVERRFIKGASHQPSFTAVAVNVPFPQIFQPDQSFFGVVMINLRSPNAVFSQKIRDRDIMPVLLALEIILNQNELLLRRAMHSIEFAIGAPLLNWSDFDLAEIKTRKTHSGLVKK